MVREVFKPEFAGILRADVKGYNRLWIEDGIGALDNQKAYWG